MRELYDHHLIAEDLDLDLAGGQLDGGGGGDQIDGVGGGLVVDLQGHAVAGDDLTQAAGGAGGIGDGDDTGGGIQGVALVGALGLGAEDGQDHLWRCAALRDERRKIDEELEELGPEAIPPTLRIGIAPAMSGDLIGTCRQ